MANVLFVVIIVFSMVGKEYYCDHPNNRSPKRAAADIKKDLLEKRALKAYRSACLRVQEMADWMSVLLKMKTLWARSVSTDNYKKLPDSHEPLRAIPEPTGHSHQHRQSRSEHSGPPPSCASLKNLQESASVYVQWQAELVRIKALMGWSFFKDGVAGLGGTAANMFTVLQDRIRNLQLMNRTSNELLEDLKLGGEGLSLQVEKERARTMNLIREAGKSNDFLSYLRSSKEKLMSQLGSLVETSQSLRKARDLMARGELLQTMGSALDKQLLTIFEAPDTSNHTEHHHEASE